MKPQAIAKFTLVAVAWLTASCSSGRRLLGPPTNGDAGSQDATRRHDGPATGTGSGTGPAGHDSGADSGSNVAGDSGADSADSGSISSGQDSGTGSDSGSSSGSGTGPAVPPSCAAGGLGLTDCGVTHECCTSLPVTGGTYARTYTSAPDGGPVGEADPASVSNFRLDKYLVTVGRFRQFLNASNEGTGPDGGTGYKPVPGSGKHVHLNGGEGLANSGTPGSYETGWVASDDIDISPTDAHLLCDPTYATWTTSAGTQETLPMNCTTWAESYAFCIWDGGFLPSEAEWEYVAAGGSQQRMYPWGTTDPGATNQYAIYGDNNSNCYFPTGTLAPCTGVANIAPVGTTVLGAALWAQLDMAGNVWEWNLDWYAPYTMPCDDCAELTTLSDRVIRGGRYVDGPTYLVASDRHLYSVGGSRAPGLGFRCARTP